MQLSRSPSHRVAAVGIAHWDDFEKLREEQLDCWEGEALE
jgi:hypothetical protein